MKTTFSRFRWIVYMAALLLLCIVGSERHERCAEQDLLADSSCAYVVGETSGNTFIDTPVDDVFADQCGTNHWGISSGTFHLRLPAGRVSSLGHHSQRIIRMSPVTLCGDIATEDVDYAHYQTIASIRFHIGYFIYHRCQMRC